QRRFRTAQRARHQSRYRIDDHQRRQLTARQHVVADGPLLIDFLLDEALIDPFVASGDQRQTRPTAGLARRALLKPASVGAQIHPPAARGQNPQRVAQGASHRLYLHHHSRSTTVRAVIDGAVRVAGVVTRVEALDLKHTPLQCPSYHAVVQRLADHLRKQRHHRNSHTQSAAASQSTTTRRAVKSTRRRCCGTAGTQYSRSPRTTIRACAGVSTKCCTTPKPTPARLTTSQPIRSAR